MPDLLDVFNFWVYVALMMTGLYAVIAKPNLVKKVLGLSLFQTGIFIFYISLGVVDDATAPIVWRHTDRVRRVLPRLEGVDARRRERVRELLREEDQRFEEALHHLEDLPEAQWVAHMDGVRAEGIARAALALGGRDPAAADDRLAALAARIEADGVVGALAEPTGLPDDAVGELEGILDRPYANPLPHVLILTAIVVSVSTTAVALALVVRIKRSYGTVEAGRLAELDR